MNSLDEGAFSQEPRSEGLAGIDGIIAALRSALPDVLPEEALRAPQRRSAEIAPALTEVIREAVESERSGNGPIDGAHIFALFLLTEFQAKEALPTILDALRLPDESDLFGDATTEVFPRTLAVLAEGRPEVLDAVIADRSLGLYPRWAAVDAYRYWVADEKMTSAEAIDRLRKQLRAAVDGKDEVCEPLACALIDLVHSSQAPEIQEAFDKNLITPEILEGDEVARSDAAWEAGTRETFDFFQDAAILDTVEELRGWYPDPANEGEEDDLAPEELLG